MEKNETMSLYRLLSRISRMSDEVKAEFGVKTIFYAAIKETEEIRKEMKHGEKDKV